MTTQDDIVKSARGSFGGGPFTSTHQDRAENNIRLHTVFLFDKDAVDAMLTDAITERTANWQVPAHMTNGVEIVSVTVLPTSALTANDTNFATLTLAKNDGAGGARTTVATLLTTVAGGNWVAFSAKAMTVDSTLATRSVASGGMLTFAVAKAAAGIQTGIFKVVAVVKEL